MKTESGKDKMLTLVGKGVSPGLAKGNAFVYIDMLQRDSELYHIDPAQVGEEQARIERAIDDVRQSLTIDAKHIEDKFRTPDIRPHFTGLSPVLEADLFRKD
jgi:phosphoenolpyruvate-protein kinase (PTS system EI component)